MQNILFKILLLVFLFFTFNLNAQIDTCISPTYKHIIKSKYSEVHREYWVNLPMRYDTSKSYPVMYVLDAEWRFDLIRHIAYDMAGNKKIPHHIIVGIPHINWKMQRGIDLTFSHSRNEYDGEKVDSTFYNKTNSGGGMNFYKYLTEEMIKDVDTNYSTNNERVLIGHSYGGYFAGYILPFDDYFSAYQIYDPSILYNDEEVIKIINTQLKPSNIFITFQLVPEFHKNKILELIELLKNKPDLKIGSKNFIDETHNSLFMQSFIDGMQFLFADFKK